MKRGEPIDATTFKQRWRVLYRTEASVRTVTLFCFTPGGVGIVSACKHEVDVVHPMHECPVAFAQLLHLPCEHYDRAAGLR